MSNILSNKIAITKNGTKRKIKNIKSNYMKKLIFSKRFDRPSDDHLKLIVIVYIYIISIYSSAMSVSDTM